MQHDHRVILDQQTDHGPGAIGWDGPAVLAGHRALGQLLLHEPALAEEPPTAQLLGTAPVEAALMPLAGGDTALLTAVAPNGLLLRRVMRQGLAAAWSDSQSVGVAGWGFGGAPGEGAAQRGE